MTESGPGRDGERHEPVCMVGNNPVVNRDAHGLIFGGLRTKVGEIAGGVSQLVDRATVRDANPMPLRGATETGMHENIMMAENRFHRFLALLQQEGQAAPLPQTLLQRAMDSYAPARFEQTRFQPSERTQNGLTLLSNSGGGDCLLHALAGRNLTFDEHIELREQIAQHTGLTLGATVSGMEIATTLMQSLPGDESMVFDLTEGRHQVSLDALQAMIRTPGMYGGDIEIRAYTALPDTREAVHVLTAQGAGRLEIRHLTPGERLTIFQGTREEAAPIIALLLEQPDIPVIHLAGAH